MLPFFTTGFSYKMRRRNWVSILYKGSEGPLIDTQDGLPYFHNHYTNESLNRVSVEGVYKGVEKRERKTDLLLLKILLELLLQSFIFLVTTVPRDLLRYLVLEGVTGERNKE